MTSVPTGAGDRYFVYRPLLDLLGLSEGTDKARGYNETLAYGAYTGGPVDLVKMTLKQVDDLQGKMLAHPKNKWNSSAVGRYQIVRTTRRNIQKALSLSSSSKFDRDMQDRMGCYLLGQRGIDKWLAGRLKLESLLDNLAREWASLPTSKGKGYYSGQNASVSVMQVTAALSEVKRRHMEGQPKMEVPIVPEAVDKAVKTQTDGWGWSGIGIGGAGAALTAIAGWPWQTIAVFAGIGIAGGLVALVIGPWIIRRVKAIRAEAAA